MYNLRVTNAKYSDTIPDGCQEERASATLWGANTLQQCSFLDTKVLDCVFNVT